MMEYPWKIEIFITTINYLKFREKNKNDMAAFWAVVCSSRLPIEKGPRAENDGDDIPPHMFILFSAMLFPSEKLIAWD